MAGFPRITLLFFFLLFLLLFKRSYNYQKLTDKNVSSDTIITKKVFAPSDDIYQSKNWIARGGCWDFSKEVVQGQGMGIRPIAYYKKKSFSDFSYEIIIKSLSDQDGSYGMLFRFDEKKDSGYIFSVWPHGDYEFCRIDEGTAYRIVSGPAVFLNNQLKTWNTLKVICKGSEFKLYLNGGLVVVAKDDKLKSGKIGFNLGHGPLSTILYKIINIFDL